MSYSQNIVYSVEALRARQELAQASIGQAEDMGKYRAAKRIVDESIEIDNEIDKAIGAIALEGLPLSLGSYAMGQKL
jgi:hypothetical protein